MHLPRILRSVTHSLAAAALPLLLVCSPALRAQDTHLVSPSQLQQQVQHQTATRQQNIDTLNQFLSTPTAQKAIKDAKIDPVQVKNAIPTLSNAELANLSARASHAQRQFAAGAISTLAIGVIIVLVVVLILVAVYH